MKTHLCHIYFDKITNISAIKESYIVKKSINIIEKVMLLDIIYILIWFLNNYFRILKYN